MPAWQSAGRTGKDAGAHVFQHTLRSASLNPDTCPFGSSESPAGSLAGKALIRDGSGIPDGDADRSAGGSEAPFIQLCEGVDAIAGVNRAKIGRMWPVPQVDAAIA